MFNWFNTNTDSDDLEEQVYEAIDEATEAMEELSEIIDENFQLAFEFIEDLNTPTE